MESEDPGLTGDEAEEQERRLAELAPDHEHFPQNGQVRVFTGSPSTPVFVRKRAKKRKRDEKDEGDQEDKKKQKTVTKQRGTKLFFITWNNYKKESIKKLITLSKVIKYAIQEEMAESGTPHLQGCIVFSKRRTFEWLRRQTGKDCHWEAARNIAACAEYCTKLETRDGKQWVRGFKTKGTRKQKEEEIPYVIIDPLDGKTLYGYQKKIMQIVKGPKDPRKIYWFWSEKGNIGKSALAKHLALKHNAYCVGGKFADAFCAIAECVKRKEHPQVIMFDLPRAMGNKISYIALEKIKDGMFFSPKYESAQCIFNTPHLIVFANQPPVREEVSLDRWAGSVFKLDDDGDLSHIKNPYKYDFSRTYNQNKSTGMFSGRNKRN